MDLGPEFRLFCLALRQVHSADEMREMRGLMAAVEDWKIFVLAARRHRVAAVLLAGLKACGSPHLPADVVAELNRQSLANARRSLAQVAEVGRLSRLFADAGIRLLALKGVALSAQLYGAPARRVARDIDLLVDPDQFLRAQEVMVAAGYRPRPNLQSPRRYSAYLRSIKEVEFVHPATGGLVELHHRLTDNPNLLACEFAALWSEREAVSLYDGDAGTVATLPRHRLPLYLCVHGAAHGWARLQWLMDFAAALPPAPRIDAAVEAAAAEGLKLPFLHALLLAQEWLGLPIESRYLAHSRDGAHIKRRKWLLGRLYSAADWHDLAPDGSWKRVLRCSLWERLYRFSLKSDWRYRASQMQRDWLSPADWDAVPLPEALSWLYPLVRPWGWLIRRLSLS